MNKVRAKFHCTKIEDFDGGKTVKMIAVVGEAGEDAEFQKYTPAGSLEMQISDDTPAVHYFESEKDYYIDITKVQI